MDTNRPHSSLSTKLAASFACIMVLIQGYPRLFHPGLHMDEGFYLGAALRLLDGDIFLTEYWFDKFFITPFALAAGILVGGETPLGFRFMALLASLCSSAVLFAWLWQIIAGRWLRPSLYILALGVWCSPFMLQFHISSFTDPFLLLFLILFARGLYRALQALPNRSASQSAARQAYHYFAIASLFKLSSLMWAPLFAVFFWQRGGPGELWRGTKEVLYTTRWWIVAGLAYSLANPRKLGPVVWFTHLGEPSGPGLWERAHQWLTSGFTIFPNTWLGVAFGAIVVLVSFYSARNFRYAPNIRTKLFALLVFPLPLHILGLWLSGAGVFGRYLYILVPQMILALAGSITVLHVSKRIKGGLAGILVILGLGFLYLSGLSYDYLNKSYGNPEFFRSLYQLRDEAPDAATIHNDGLLWYLHPFSRSGKIDSACLSKECLKTAQLGRQPYNGSYILTATEGFAEYSLQRFVADCPNCQNQNFEVDLGPLVSTVNLRDRLRIFGWAQSLTWQVINQSGQPKFHIKVDSKNLPMIGNIQINIKGQLVLRNNSQSRDAFGPGRWTAALRLEDIRVNQSANLIDLAPLVYKTYTVALGPIGLASRDNNHDQITGLHWQGSDQVLVELRRHLAELHYD